LNAAAVENYIARFRKVLDYIDAHSDEDLGIERLSGIAAFSKYHFHRQFTLLFGIGVYKYVQLSRLKRASFQLAFRSGSQILDIALASGYEGPEAFSRAFRKNIGQSPSEFRREPQWIPWDTIYQPLSVMRSRHMDLKFSPEKVGIIDFKETRVAVFQHRGDLRLIGDSIRQVIEWRKKNHLPPSVSATFNIFYDDPQATDPADFRCDICAATDREIEPNAFGIMAKIIPGGRCAVYRHVGADDAISAIAEYLYSEWLPQSGEDLRDYPLFLQRVSFFPDVPENEAVIDVFLPLK
jgi:AraC family transcriptional regulator